MNRGELIEDCGYLSQIATMADAVEINTDGPLLKLSFHTVIWVPLDAEYRAHAWSVILNDGRPY